MNKLVKGEKYKFNHARKGAFTGILRADGKDFVDIEITEGTASYVVAADGQPGDTITVRRSFLTWEPVQ